MKSGKSETLTSQRKGQTKVSAPVALIVILFAILASSLLGWITRLHINGVRFEVATNRAAAHDANEPINSLSVAKTKPIDYLHSSEPGQRTNYFSKTFDSEAAAACSSIHLDGAQVDSTVDSGDSDDENEKETFDSPTGYHLLVDIKHVDANFLNSEKRLSQAITELAKEAKLPLLSYHCHSLIPIGISCVGVLVKSHITVHTWPLEGVISMDLFSGSSGKLIPVVPVVERLFGIQQQVIADNNNDQTAILDSPAILWSHKLRGFRDRSWDSLDHDFGEDYTSKRYMELKNHVVSEETDFQQVDVIEVIDPIYLSMASYLKSLLDDGSYESLHAQLFSPNRLVFLDGQIQSTLKGEAAYHEALVHPAMITHPNPKRVAVIGGGEGATLREILKHDTVEQAIMLEIDGEEVEILRDSIPEWSDCSEFSEEDSCYDDPRTELLAVDAIGWFIDRFGEDKSDESPTAEPFDVIIMDALDPNDGIEFAAGLYNSSTFERSLNNALTDDGILVAQLGRSPMHRDAPDESSPFANRAGMMNTLEQLGYESFHVYDEAHADFDAPWSYLVALKNRNMRSNWYRTAPELDIDLQKRIRTTKSGKTPLLSFDAATMVEYQLPPKTFEINYCRKNDVDHKECKHFFDVCNPTMSREDCILSEAVTNTKVYSPAIERHLSAYGRTNRTVRGIKVGEDMVANYHVFSANINGAGSCEG